MIPKLTKLKIENGPLVKDDQTIGDTCIAF